MTLAGSDAASLIAVQRACYGDSLIESAEVYRRRLASPAGLSLGAIRHGALVAYLAAYRSRLGKVTPLHGDFASEDLPDALYLHDLAVRPTLAGQGVGQRLVASLVAGVSAEGLGQVALVAVPGARRYWAGRGFRQGRLADADQQRHLATYGPGAVYLTRPL